METDSLRQTCIWTEGVAELATRACLPARSLLMDALSSSPSSLDSIFDVADSGGGETYFLSDASGTASTPSPSALSSSASSIDSSGRPFTFACICLPTMLFQFAPRIILFLGPWSVSLRCEVCSESIGLLVRHDGIWRWYCCDCFLDLRQSLNDALLGVAH